MKILNSMRWRLQLWYGALLLAVLCGFGFTAYQLERGRVLRQIDEELQRRLPILVESQRPVRGNRELREFSLSPRNAGLFEDAPGGAPFYYVVWLKHSERTMTSSSTAPREVPMPHAGDPPTRQRGDLRETFLFPGPGDCVLVGRSISEDMQSLSQMSWRLAGVALSVLLLGCAVGGWLVGRALRPIHEISTTAGMISAGDLSKRIHNDETTTELSHLIAVLNSTFARLEAAFAQQARFTADAAHELRTPLSVMLTHAQNGLGSPCESNEHTQSFAAIQRGAQRMRRLIDSLLELARLDAGQDALRRQVFDLGGAAQDVVDMLGPLAQERGIAIQSQLAPTDCFGDFEHLSQVIINLVTNAILHNHIGGQVKVQVHGEEDWASLSVSDHGPGIPKEDLAKVFERFYRGDSSRSSLTGGSGLGLAICKAIVDAHGGMIEVRSVPGEETRFTVRLPKGPSSQQNTSQNTLFPVP